MRFTALHLPELVEHEPLWPVAGIPVLVGKHFAQQVGDAAVMPQREQEFQRALADIARTPGGSAVLLHAARRGVVNHRMVRKPLDGVRQLRRDGRSSCHVEVREQRCPNQVLQSWRSAPAPAPCRRNDRVNVSVNSPKGKSITT